jgi:hypothetical protein
MLCLLRTDPSKQLWRVAVSFKKLPLYCGVFPVIAQQHFCPVVSSSLEASNKPSTSAADNQCEHPISSPRSSALLMCPAHPRLTCQSLITAECPRRLYPRLQLPCSVTVHILRLAAFRTYMSFLSTGTDPSPNWSWAAVYTIFACCSACHATAASAL